MKVLFIFFFILETGYLNTKLDKKKYLLKDYREKYVL